MRLFHLVVLRRQLLFFLVKLSLEILDLQFVLDDVTLILVYQEIATHLKLDLLLLSQLLGCRFLGLQLLLFLSLLLLSLLF